MNMKIKLYFFLFLIFLVLAGCVTGPDTSSKNQMTGSQLKSLLREGRNLELGDDAHGYHGELRLNPDGTGIGYALTNGGKEYKIHGTWEIVGDEFCRTWKDMDDGKTVCERWILVKENKVEVYTSAGKIGVNSW
jgi:hypothetical protein